VDNLAKESLKGFASGSGIQIRVSGSRTVGLFILPGAQDSIDNAAISGSLQDSIRREAQSFAGVTDLRVVSERPVFTASATTISAAEVSRFAEMQLPGVRFADTNVSSRHWLVVQAHVTTYTAGSTVYLLVTSSPLVIGLAVVGADGTARIEGALPLDTLGGGAHRLRIVGSRDFGTVSVSEQGSLQIPPQTLTQIRLFDQETTAVVEVAGMNADGGARLLVRYIPLHEDAPYWMLLILLDLDLLVLYLRRRRRLVSLPGKAIAGATLGAAATAIGWIGWTMRYPEISAASGVLLLIGLLLLVGLPALGYLLLRMRRSFDRFGPRARVQASPPAGR